MVATSIIAVTNIAVQHHTGHQLGVMTGLVLHFRREFAQTLLRLGISGAS